MSGHSDNLHGQWPGRKALLASRRCQLSMCQLSSKVKQLAPWISQMWRWHSRASQSRTLSKDTSPSRITHPTCSGYGYSVAPYGTAYRSALGTTRIRRTTRIREHPLEGDQSVPHHPPHLRVQASGCIA